MFSTLPVTNFNYGVRILLSSVNSLNLEKFKILSFGKELSHFHTKTPFDESGKDAV